MKAALHLLAILSLVAQAFAATTIDGSDKYAYGANFGWINLEGDVTNGVVVAEYVCSGFAWSANCGWINFGDGTPADGIQYQNDSAADFGVNVTNYECTSPADYTADLRGFAYGANFGWINFEALGDPRVDLNSGMLRGYAWSANCGWINLGELGVNVSTTFAPGADTDLDGIADAYEMLYAGDLTTLGAMNDEDGDGVSDVGEYESDTDPLDQADRFWIIHFEGSELADEFDITFTTKLTRVYQLQDNPDMVAGWADIGDLQKPTGATMTVTVTDPGGSDSYFWRATAQLPLQP